MQHHDILNLIQESPAARGVYDECELIERTVFCVARSVGMQEMYEALSHGFHPTWKFVLSQSFEYHGEKRLRYQGELYSIIRTYVNDADEIELTAEKVNP